MNKQSMEIFEREIKRQCRIFFMSVEYLDEYYENPTEVGVDKVWYHIQSFLTSSANISKLLWGVNMRISQSRKELREKLGVFEDSPLKHRKMRNFFEHFDEHLEKWVKDNSNSIFIDSNIGPKTAIINDSDKYQFLRNFNPASNIITFKDHEYDMKVIADEVYKIYIVVSQQ
ncbi:hypothetical protein [Bacillus licheniformis]|uniref:hypothetical protein n=1 Tax=Bacillus licheniformis TaxID=1402 RepID=UPI000BA578DA|nr:hypothetical protein [Bacillus licheniformis]PAE70576.1 hypothetical protein CHH84_19840 [Bacillus licheniformis]